MAFLQEKGDWHWSGHCDIIDTLSFTESEVEQIQEGIIDEVMRKRTDTILETPRLWLREYRMEDFTALYEMLSDPETMAHYPKPYDEAGTNRWLKWSMDNYREHGFGLWVVERKEDGAFLGDCGITMQLIDGQKLPEIGYHIHKRYWRQGYGSEAARAVRDWGFANTSFDTLYSYMKYTNVGSYSTARSIGMEKIKEYPDKEDGILYVYSISRARWEQMKTEHP